MPTTIVASLSLSDDTAVESVLADIPFFCVGILAFGISTFFLVMKQVNLPSLYLYLSALSAFAASIFDLSQLLARGSYNVVRGYDADSVRGLINTREVSLALSIGLRFIFFWTFVAERPRGEPPPIPQEDHKTKYEPRYHAHSASWQRWGYLGFILKWGLLALTVAIPTMQIIWRIAQRQFGLIYTAESTMEIVASSLFILKLFLNIFLSPLSPWWLRFLSYLGPIAALLISLGIGIGQLVLFAFSETTLGRFLQAIELYILIVFLLMDAFYITPEMRRYQVRKAQASSFNGLGGFRSSESLPRQTLSAEMIDHNDIRESTRTTRESVVLSGPSSSVHAPLFLWDRNDPELGGSSGRRHSSTKEMVYATSDSRTSPQSPQIQSGTEDAPLPLPVPLEELTPTNKSDLPLRPKTGVSFSSYYPEDHSSSLPTPKPNFVSEVSGSGPDSPIYGLNGIIGAIGDNWPTGNKSESLNSRSSTSFDELLRQQSELDQSIAALRLFSPEASTATFLDAKDVATPDAPAKSTSMAPTASTGTNSCIKVDSSSVPSEFSLSIFPEPPTNGSGLPDTPVASIAGRNMIIPPSPTVDEVPSMPTSPNGLSTGRFDSGGTQYDVTSFIGGLTHPSDSQQPSLIFKGTDLSDVESMDESPTIVTGTNRSARPLLLSSTMPSLASLPSREDSSSLDPVSPRQNAALRPFLLGNVTSAPATSSPLSSTVLTTPYVSRNPPIGPRRPIPILGRSAGYRLLISGPKPTERVEEPDAYERPRQPPPILSEPSGSTER